MPGVRSPEKKIQQSPKSKISPHLFFWVFFRKTQKSHIKIFKVIENLNIPTWIKEEVKLKLTTAGKYREVQNDSSDLYLKQYTRKYEAFSDLAKH